MFDSVLKPDFSQTRFGSGALVALAAHAIVATLAVTLSGQKPKAIVDSPRWPIVKIHRSTPLVQSGDSTHRSPRSSAAGSTGETWFYRRRRSFPRKLPRSHRKRTGSVIHGDRVLAVNWAALRAWMVQSRWTRTSLFPIVLLPASSSTKALCG
jgi:hypothetical protein